MTASAPPPPGGPDDVPLSAVADRLVVPDDAGALHRDAVALRRERRAAARRAGLVTGPGPGRGGESGAGAPGRPGSAPPPLLLLLVLAVVAVVGGSMTALAPRPGGQPQATALATAPSAPPGRVGGLLPASVLRGADGGLSARSPRLRPGVLALVPAGCECDAAVATAVDETLSYRLRLRLVTAASEDPDGAEAARLQDGPADGRVPRGVDVGDRLTTAYARDGLTLVLVRADGTVDRVVRGVRPGQRLEPHLQRLVGRTPPS